MKKIALVTLFLLCAVLLFSCGTEGDVPPEIDETERIEETEAPVVPQEPYFNYKDVPEYDGKTPYTIVNGNKPFFDKSEFGKRAFESYGKLDNLGRCTTVSANIGKELMPKKNRESIASVKPTGWQIAQYDCVDGTFLYNRCHLIGFQLTGENANERNLITGTRYFNTQGMLPFENLVADYIKETGNHVLYRVTPIFDGRELIARGVLMEAFSLEDNGEGICFNIFCYNVQPDVEIDYATGESKYIGDETTTEIEGVGNDEMVRLYVLNTNTMKIHKPDCQSVVDMDDMNRLAYRGSIEELREMEYTPCGSCKP